MQTVDRIVVWEAPHPQGDEWNLGAGSVHVGSDRVRVRVQFSQETERLPAPPKDWGIVCSRDGKLVYSGEIVELGLSRTHTGQRRTYRCVPAEVADNE